MNTTMSRRGFLKLAGVTAAMAAMSNIPGGLSGKAEAAEAGNVATDSLQVPYCEGRNVPQIAVPKNACDCAHHIFDPVRFAYKPDDVRNQPPATVDVYRMLQKKLGLTRSVAINPSAYGFDNRCMLDAIKQLGQDKTHGIAVIPDDISDKELEKLNQGGIVGIRYNVSRGAVVDEKKVRRMADRIKEFDWNMHFWMPADIEIEYADLLSTLPVQVVFDHRGHLPKDQGVNHPAFKLICNLLQDGKAWVKLSAQYHDSSLENDYADTVAVGKAYVAAAPDRVVWGTDWPHPSEFTAKRDFPDDAHLLDLLAVQAPDEKIRHKILVENPAKLYKFE